jgi:outer membrane protein assembly factor BamE (lipoprotein component of BamABCDE complex)
MVSGGLRRPDRGLRLPKIRVGGTAGVARTQGGSGIMRDASVQRKRRRVATYGFIVTLALGLGGCFGETFQRGYVLPEGALEQIPLGASQEQVLIVLGTPSTVATVSGEAFYYISQRAERKVSFLQARVVDQRVIAIYFDRSRRVQRVASYGLKDGKVFDFISRTTPTAGSDMNVIKGILDSLANSKFQLPL